MTTTGPDPGTRTPAALHYTLPAADGAVLLGLHPAALTGLAVTATTATLLLLTGASPALVALLTVTGCTLATLAVAGRTPLGWAPTLTRLGLRRLGGRDRHPAHPTHHATPAATAADRQLATVRERTSPAPEPMLTDRQGQPLRLGLGPRPLRLRDVGEPGSPLAGVTARPDRTTVVLESTGTGRFGLLDPHAQDSDLARWGACLAILLASPDVAAVQWLTHTRPDTPDPAGVGLAPGMQQDGQRGELFVDYQQLLHELHAQAWQHRHLLAVTFTSTHASSRRTIRPDAQGRHREVLTARTREVVTALLGADLLAAPLAPAELGSLLRLLLDPSQPDQGPQPDPACWAAGATRTDWTHCRTDDTLHRCYTVTGWPRLALTADWLAPLLHQPPPDGTARTLSVHASPVTARQATRRARASSARTRLDLTDRARLGFSPAVRDSLDAADAAATETELVAGYRMTDLSAVLAVHAPDPARLEDACRQLRAHALAHRIDLRPLHGQHHTALAAALPLGLHPGATP